MFYPSRSLGSARTQGSESAAASISHPPAGPGEIAPSGDWLTGGGARGDQPPAFAPVRRAAAVEPVGDDTRVGGFDYPGARGGV